MPHGAVCHTYHQEFFEYEPSKRRGFDHSSSKTSLRLSHSHHEYQTFWEEMEHFCALRIYRYKCTCDEYEDEQRRLHPASKKSSSATKRASSRGSHENRVMEPKRSRSESKSRESMDELRNFMKEWADSMTVKFRKMLETSSTLPSSQKLHVPSENEFDDVIHESEHEVQTEGIERES